ncbi:TPA: hypothetical protein SMQ86_006063 [Pseudomonas aeruginosa]|nr:hypothetical protein [Pseudomonas aeruginosa]
MSVSDDVKTTALPGLEHSFEEIAHLFRTGAVPREVDYRKLIEYVHYLHKLLGIEGDAGHSPALGPGLTVTSGGVMSVDVATLASSGLIANGATLAVGAGAGISVDATQVSVNGATLAGSGLIANGATLAVGAGAGISVDATQVSVNGATLAGSGLIANGATLAVGAGEGISVNATQVSVNGATLAGNGLVANGAKLAVGGDKGIEVVDNYVRLASDSWEFLMGKMFGASHVCIHNDFIAFLSQTDSCVAVRVFARMQAYIKLPLETQFNGAAPVGYARQSDNFYQSLIFMPATLDSSSALTVFTSWADDDGGHYEMTVTPREIVY